ncbi:MAG: TfoX/Sxy family protein [Saprospiraceae bacterium]
MAVSKDYLDYVTEQLSEFGEVMIKKMFGGAGLYFDGLIFGLITAKDVFCLKVDDTNRADYEEKGMTPFGATETKKGMPYWEVPVEVLEDRTELAVWAMKSLEVTINSKSKKKK